MGQPVKAAAYDLYIVSPSKIHGEEGTGRKELKVLRDVFAAAAPALPSFQGMEQSLINIIGTVDKPDAAELPWHGNSVPPEELSMTIEVGQDYVNRLAHIFCRAALVATLTQGYFQFRYRLADIT